MQRYNRDSRIESRRPNLSQKKATPALVWPMSPVILYVESRCCALPSSLFACATEAACATRGVGELLYLLPFYTLVASHNQLCNTFPVVYNKLTIR